MSGVTVGAIHRIKNGETFMDPVIQVMNIKQMEAASSVSATSASSVRFRCVFTDGQECMSGMLATQLNQRITSGEFHENAIVRITKYMIQPLQSQKFLIVLEFQKVGAHPGPLMKSNVGEGGASTAASAPPANPPAYGQTSYNPPAASYAPAPAPAPAPGYNSYGNNIPQYGAAPASTPALAPAFPPAAPPSYGMTPSTYSTAPNPYNNPPPAANAPPSAVPYSSAPPAYNNQYGAYGGNNASKPVVRNENVTIVPISAINPYSNKWTIKARVTAKTDRRSWTNAKGSGTLFSIDVLDSHGGEIRATFFKESCEKWFPMLEEGKVYTFSGGQVKVVANRQYTQIKNQYELTFNVNSDIFPVSDDHEIKTQQYNFTKIEALGYAEVGGMVDVIGVVRAASDVAELNSAKLGGKTLIKRDLTLVDETNSEVKLTLWGDKAQAPYEWHLMPVAAFRAVKLGDYGGRSLSTLNNSSIVINPPIPEGFALNEWKKQFNGSLPAANSLSSAVGGGGGMEALEKRRTIASIRDENLGSQPDRPDIITIKASIVYIKHDTDPWYNACPTPQCNKKVTEGQHGQFICDKCNKTHDNCHRRYIMNCTMADTSGSNWFTFFNETAEKILGVSAETLYSYRLDSREDLYEKVFADALFKQFVCKVRVKQENVNEEMRTKSSGMRVEEVDFLSECQQMIDAIRKYN